jgi:hypothetical protein
VARVATKISLLTELSDGAAFTKPLRYDCGKCR